MGTFVWVSSLPSPRPSPKLILSGLGLSYSGLLYVVGVIMASL